MPKVNIEGKSNLAAADTFTRVQEVLESDSQIKGIDPNIKVDVDTSALKGTAKGKQFSAEFSVSDAGEGSTIHIVVDLPFILSPIKGKVKAIIEQKIEKALS